MIHGVRTQPNPFQRILMVEKEADLLCYYCQKEATGKTETCWYCSEIKKAIHKACAVKNHFLEGHNIWATHEEESYQDFSIVGVI